MFLDKCFFDTYMAGALAFQLQKENVVNEEIEFSNLEKRLSKKALKMMTLYDKIDTSSLYFSYDHNDGINYLVNNNIVDKNNHINSFSLFDKENFSHKDTNLLFAKDLAEQIIIDNENKIINNFIQESPLYNRKYSNNSVYKRDLFNNYNNNQIPPFPL